MDTTLDPTPLATYTGSQNCSMDHREDTAYCSLNTFIPAQPPQTEPPQYHTRVHSLGKLTVGHVSLWNLR